MRRRYHPPADPKDAERIAEHYDGDVDVDAFFYCRHGVDKCQERCHECDLEVQDFWERVDREAEFNKE